MRILIYGTGKTATEIVERGLGGKVIGYIETIRTKDAHCGIPVYSPSEICKQTYDAIIVSSHYVDAIYYTLIEQGIDIKKVIFFHKFWNDGILKSNKWKKSILGDENYYQYIKNQTVIRAYSQCDQDLVVLGIFAKNKLSKGRYIDIGAHDGVSLSNTKIFEEIGWDGVCIEPNPDVFKLLMKNRRSINLNVAISDKNGTADFIKINGKSEMLSGIADFMSESHEKRIKSENSQNGGDSEKIVVKTRNIMGIIDEYFTDRHIDFMSIDVEGGEFKILKSIDFEKYVIDLLVVEKNYDESIVYEFMMSQGYYCIPLEQDDLFIRRG